MLKDLVGRPAETVSLPDGARVSDLVRRYHGVHPRMQTLLPAVAVAVNQEFAAPTTELRDNDEVGLLPPVSGGAPEPRVQLTRERIRPYDVVPACERPEDGAIVIFDGIVRNHSRGRATLYLDYEAYEEMALKQMRALASEALSRFSIRDVALVHRLGRIDIGESSVLIAVFSAHRAAAFDACRWLIDTLKTTVPIWKKEHFLDGAVWADGEPFPEQVAAGKRSLAPHGASK
jgi:molybdopterin synthase catalytic subunit